MRFTIGKKLGLNSFVFIVLFIIVGMIIFAYNRDVIRNTVNIAEVNLPGAIYSLSMLEEIGDMNSNLLEYMLGELDEKDGFEYNYQEFNEFLDRIKLLETISDKVQNNEHTDSVKKESDENAYHLSEIIMKEDDLDTEFEKF